MTTESGTRPVGSAADDTASLERSLARLLTIGSYVAVVLLTIGLVLLLGAGISPLAAGPAFDPGRLIADLLAVRPEGFLWLGLVLVVVTPAVRVAASLVGYLERGERGMVIVAGLILFVIAASVVLAKGLEG